MFNQRSFIVLLFLACGLGFALRVYRLEAQPLWYDEGLSVDLALSPPVYVLTTINRPPLYYGLLHAWVRLAGVTTFTFRFFSAWWGTLSLPLFYRLGRQLLGRQAGMWAMGLATLSPFYVYYAQEARTYALTLALALVSSVALFAWLTSTRRRWLALHGIASLVCLYTHYTALLLPIAQAGFVLLSAWQDRHAARWRAKRVLTWLAVQAIVGLLFLPWPLYARHGLVQLVAPQLDLPPLNPIQVGARMVWSTLAEFSAGRTLTWLVADSAPLGNGVPLSNGIALVFLFLVILGAISPGPPKQSRRFLLVLLGLPSFALLLLPRTGIYFAPKYLIVASPAFYLLTVLGLQALRREARRLFILCVVLIVLAAILGLTDWFFWPHSRMA